MAYTKTLWKDRAVQFPRRYLKSGETSTEVTLDASPGTVTEAGTPFNATNLNKMEQGIADAHDASIQLALIKTVDGAGSGLDTDLLQGRQGSKIFGARSSFPNNTDFNTVTNVGFYNFGDVITGAAPNNPGMEWGVLEVMNSDISATGFSGGYLIQRAYSLTTGAHKIRYRNESGAWGSWQAIWTSSQLRDNTGVLEFFTGGAWKPVGGIKSVQRGLANIGNGGTSVDVPIAVVNLSKAFVNPIFTYGPNDTYYELLNSSTLRITVRGLTAGYSGIPWEVVESY